LPRPIELPITNAPFKFQDVFSSSFQSVANLGHTLYNLVFTREIASKFQAYLNRRKEDDGVRLCICSQSGVLSDAVWEILCNSLEPIENFLSLDPKTPIVRIPRIGKEVYLREMGKPLRILVILSSPRFVQSIDPKKEKLIWEQSLSHLIDKDYIVVDFIGFDSRKEASFDTLQEALSANDLPYDIVHIIGHGLLEESNEGILALVNPQDGRQYTVTASGLANLFRSRRVMLVVLQSCQSGAIDSCSTYFAGMAQHLVAAGVPAVLAMQEFIDQDVARHFVEKFYTNWLNQECPFEDAITQARQGVYGKFKDRLGAWAIPVLYICPGTQLFVRGFDLSKGPDFDASGNNDFFETNERQIEAALPKETRLNKQTELITLIRTSTNPSLREILNAQPQDFEARPEDVRTSSTFEVSFPIDEMNGKLLPKNVKLAIETSDFDIVSPEEVVQIRPQGDSVLNWFLLTPRKEGLARISVKLIDISGEKVTLAQLLLKTRVRDGQTFETEYRVIDKEQIIMGSASVLRKDLQQQTQDFFLIFRPHERLQKSLNSLEHLRTSDFDEVNFSDMELQISRIHDSVKGIQSKVSNIIELANNFIDGDADGQIYSELLNDSLPIRLAYDIWRICGRIVDRCMDLLHISRENIRGRYIANELYILECEIRELHTKLSNREEF
jgi:hypothetical protein